MKILFVPFADVTVEAQSEVLLSPVLGALLHGGAVSEAHGRCAPQTPETRQSALDTCCALSLRKFLLQYFVVLQIQAIDLIFRELPEPTSAQCDAITKLLRQVRADHALSAEGMEKRVRLADDVRRIVKSIDPG